MTDTIERLTFRGGEPSTHLQSETVKLHMERYQFASKHVKGKRVLDLACGAGYGSALLKDAGADKVFGIDIAPEAIAEANESFLKPGIEFHCLDYRQLFSSDTDNAGLIDLRSNGVDVIVSLETIEHIPDPADFLATVTKLLKTGGLLIGSVPVTPSMDGNPYHLHDFSPKSFRRLLSQAGLRPGESLLQRQPFNPLKVHSQMEESNRPMRPSLVRFYLANPGKLILRIQTTLLNGFANIYEVVVAEKVA